MSRARLLALLLAFTTLLVFLPVGWHPFADYDDADYVVNNSFVKSGLTATDIRWAFTTFHAANWHPLTWLSHQADCELFGLNAGAQHMVNVLFHAVNVVLLFVLLRRLTGKLWPAAFVAALFGWHPLHVESVAWIAERKDLLSTFFALLALLSYVQYAREGKAAAAPSVARHPRRFFWLAVIFFTLGLLAKPMLVTLPFMLLLLDFWPLQRMVNTAKFSSLVAEKIPFFLLAAASCVITFLAQKNGGAIVPLVNVTFAYRLENAILAAATYLLKFFWPGGLCIIYPLNSIALWQVVVAGGVLVFISAAVWHWRQTKPYLLFGWLWFLGTLVPVIGLVQIGSQSMADRYTYIPSIGLFIAIAFLTYDLVIRVGLSKIMTAGLATLILLACIGATEFQLQFWRNGETLFRRAIAVTHGNTVAYINLGFVLETEHRSEEALAAYREAERLGITPYYQLYNNLGNVLSLLGRHEEALAEYQTAIRLQPDRAILHNAAGDEWAALGNYDEALKEFAAAKKIDPDYAWSYIETAKVFLKLNRDLEAVSELHAAAHLTPDNFQILATVAHYLAANENDAGRDGPAALALATKADELSEHVQPMVLDVLGMAYAETGDFAKAQACAQNAIDVGTAVELKNIEPFRQRLELYKQNQPWRESFRATNAPITPILKLN